MHIFQTALSSGSLNFILVIFFVVNSSFLQVKFEISVSLLLCLLPRSVFLATLAVPCLELSSQYILHKCLLTDRQ